VYGGAVDVGEEVFGPVGGQISLERYCNSVSTGKKLNGVKHEDGENKQEAAVDNRRAGCQPAPHCYCN